MRNLRWAFAAVVAAAVVAVERPAPAMTDTDLTSTSWDTAYASRLKLPGLGSDTSDTTGTVAFSSDGTFSASEDDGGVPRTYTGTWRLKRNGKRLRLALDADGRAALSDAISDWLEEIAADEGLTLSDLSVRLARVTMKQARLPDTAGDFTTKISATGQARGRLGRRRVSSALIYNSNVSVTVSAP